MAILFCTHKKLSCIFILQVVQSLKEKSQTKNYSELGSCPSLNSGRRPLLARNVGCSTTGDNMGDDAAIFGTGQDTGAVEEFVQTAKGKILVARQGDPKKPVIITYHDIGLNYLSNFQVNFRLLLIFFQWERNTNKLFCYLSD